MHPSPLAIAIGICLTYSALAAQTTAPSYPDSPEGLRQWTVDLLNAAEARDQAKTLAIFQDFMLKDPEKYFSNVFNDAKGVRLAKEYKSELEKFPTSMASLFLRLDSPTKLSIDIVCVETPDDPNAKAYQSIALAAMTNPVPLYSLRVYKPGTSASIGIWSIVHHEGSWRFAGRMKAAKD